MVRPSNTRTLPVAFPGSRGAYGQTAARRFFGTGATLTCDTTKDAVRAVVDGRASHAVVPVENSITGALAGIAEAFFEGDVSVVGEVVLPIRHCLLGRVGGRLEDLSVVASHPSSLAQCRDWLTSWGLAARPVPDTSQAARELARKDDAALAVLGSRELADAYGLEVLADGISDRPDNRTRFLVLAAPMEPPRGDGSRHALQIGPVTAPRALKTLRIQLESLGASRVRVPFLGAEDGRRFLAEFDCTERTGPELAAEACGSLPHRFLGAWDPCRRMVPSG